MIWVLDEEEEEGGVLLTWAVWAEQVLEMLELWSPEELLEEWEDCKEEEGDVVGLR